MDFGESDRVYTIRSQHRLGGLLLRSIPERDIDLIDVGCGMGEFINGLSGDTYNISCVDGSDHCVEYVRSQGQKCSQVDLETDTLPFKDESFDVAVSLDVIEHLWNTEHYLHELKRVVRPRGYIILTTPNYNYIRFRALCMMGKFDSFTYGSQHKKFFTVSSFKKAIAEDIDIIKVVGFSQKGRFHLQIRHGLNLFAGQIGVLGRFK